METEDVVHVLRNVQQAVRPGGSVLDTHPLGVDMPVLAGPHGPDGPHHPVCRRELADQITRRDAPCAAFAVSRIAAECQGARSLPAEGG